jgi:hypothetical protein
MLSATITAIKRGFPGSVVYDFKYSPTASSEVAWSLRQRARRPNFVVNNSRLVILPERQSFSNLASRVLGLCLRAAQQRLEVILVYRGNQQPGRGAFRLGRRPVALRAVDLRARAVWPSMARRCNCFPPLALDPDAGAAAASNRIASPPDRPRFVSGPRLPN